MRRLHAMRMRVYETRTIVVLFVVLCTCNRWGTYEMDKSIQKTRHFVRMVNSLYFSDFFYCFSGSLFYGNIFVSAQIYKCYKIIKGEEKYCKKSRENFY